VHRANDPNILTRNAPDLLVEFGRTGQQQLFEEVLTRYAAMVYGVCLRITKDAHDAEDATQAAFLALASQVRLGKPVRSVGPWLQKVAKRLSMDIRRSHKRRVRREQWAASLNRRNGESNGNGDHHCPSAGFAREELSRLLGEELEGLPTKYRLPLILHYFGGLTRQEMAQELGIKPNTLGVRVYRGRKLLGKRLAKRGIVLGASALGIWLGEAARSAVSAGLLSRTSMAVAQIVAGPEAAVAQVLSVTRGVGHAVRMAKLKTLVAAVVLCVSALAGAAEIVHRVYPMGIALPGAAQIVRPLRDLIRLILGPPQFTSVSPEQQPPQTPATVTPVPGYQRPPALVDATGEKPDSLASLQQIPLLRYLRRTAHDPVPAAPSPSQALRSYTSTDDAPGVEAQSAAEPLRHNAKPSPQPTAIARPQLRLAKSAEDVPAAASSVATTPQHRRDALPQPPAVVRQRANNWPVLGEGRGESDHGFLGAGTALTSSSGITVGGEGSATFTHTGGIHTVDGAMVIGAGVGGSGTYQLAGDGYVHADQIQIGAAGAGSFEQQAGTSSAGMVVLGATQRGSGTYVLRGGALLLDPGPVPMLMSVDAQPPTIFVGVEGSGLFELGGPTVPGRILEAVPGSSLTVRGSAGGSGEVRGWGSVGLTGSLVNNGRIVADGYGSDRALDLSSASRVVNAIDNTASEGWYAEHGGELILPALRMEQGSGVYAWGESRDELTPDLVNSVLLNTDGVRQGGQMTISLLSLDRKDVPALPVGHKFIGLWRVDAGQVVLDRMDLAVRYDESLAQRLGVNEGMLKIWVHRPGGEWTRIDEQVIRRFGAANIIAGPVTGANLDYFAISAPEPTCLGAVLLAAWGLLRRGNRRCRIPG
jgi:RNA polymerase sigma factor (sigma-70 family)